MTKVADVLSAFLHAEIEEGKNLRVGAGGLRQQAVREGEFVLQLHRYLYGLR